MQEYRLGQRDAKKVINMTESRTKRTILRTLFFFQWELLNHLWAWPYRSFSSLFNFTTDRIIRKNFKANFPFQIKNSHQCCCFFFSVFFPSPISYSPINPTLGRALPHEKKNLLFIRGESFIRRLDWDKTSEKFFIFSFQYYTGRKMNSEMDVSEEKNITIRKTTSSFQKNLNKGKKKKRVRGPWWTSSFTFFFFCGV